MTTFYANLTLMGPQQEKIVDYLNQQGRVALVSPTIDAFTVVYDQGCEDQQRETLHQLGLDLCTHFNCPVLAVMNKNDDVLWYQLFNKGGVVDEYNSTPDYDGRGRSSRPEGGDADLLCMVFGVDQEEKVERVLRRPSNSERYLSAETRHWDLMRSLKLPLFAVGMGFTYISQGDIPEGLNVKDIIKTGE
jgi:hypothetical protein